jgi:transcriptional regulator with XRE-family HTH domain
MSKDYNVFEVIENRVKNVVKTEESYKKLKKKKKRKDIKKRLNRKESKELEQGLLGVEEAVLLDDRNKNDPRISHIVARNCRSTFLRIQKLTYGTFKCPYCKNIKTNPRQWVTSKDRKKVICRSCFQTKGWNPKSPNVNSLILFEKEELRYNIDSLSLCRMRENLKLSVEQFSALVGWSPSYQYQLEEGKFTTISEKTMEEIRQAFLKKGFKITKDIWGDPIIYYIVEPELLRSARKLVGLSMKTISDKMKWSVSYQSKIERGLVRIVSKNVADAIQSIFYSLT